MAKPTYSYWRIIAITGGVALTVIEVIGAVSYLAGQASPSYLIAGGALVTVVAAMLPVLAERCWQGGRRLLASLLWLALVPALSLIFTAAVERTGGARDEANRDRQAIAQRIELARTAETEAKTVADSDEAAAKVECGTGRGQKCLGLEARADISRKRLEAARTAVAQAGVVPSDPQARRLAAILPGVSESAIQLYQPIILPVSISVLGLLLIAVGAHTPKRRMAKKRRGRRKRRALGRVGRPSAKVIPFKKAN